MSVLVAVDQLLIPSSGVCIGGFCRTNYDHVAVKSQITEMSDQQDQTRNR